MYLQTAINILSEQRDEYMDSLIGFTLKNAADGQNAHKGLGYFFDEM